MPQIIIDGQRIEAAAGKTIIEAALDNGINIPHFCWHPSLSVAGNCRMCLVNVGSIRRAADGSIEHDADGNVMVNYMPKMQIGCATPVADGMVVDTQSHKTESAQNAVMEFLLINHPLDCPICDEAGQCKLQEYSFEHSKGKSRFDEQKVHKPKRVELGPQIMFDGERCISCSRCIRFADEIAKQPAITFVQRGDKVTIENFPGTTFDSPYSMNVIDICPVGALTSKDFRFKTRVWEMSFNDSICTGCSRGCNTKVGVRDNTIMRIEPRTNMHVNEYWMCDHGRLTQYDFVNENRVSEPMIRNSAGQLVKADWNDAYAAAAELLRSVKHQEIMVIGSSKSSNEDNYLLAKFAKSVLKTNNIDFVRHFNEEFGDSFLRTRDMSPNAHGAMESGIAHHAQHGTSIDHLADKISQGFIKALYVMDEDIALIPKIASVLDKVQVLIVHTHNATATAEKAHVVFASSTYAESEGTYTNVTKRVQHFTPAIVTKENERYMGMKMSRWDKFGAFNDRWTQGERRNSRMSWRIVQGVANAMNAQWQYKDSESVFEEMTHHVDGFKGMSYELLDEYGGMIMGRIGTPESKGVVYESHYFKPQVS
ncbi:MAG: molybdopterin-dependent oxidoreductase [Candidatus Kapabacteria bacterium]|nr:molybdopterin-dependent oxidoreductase [Candidatus Kapabacteria bacterium]